MIQKRIQEYENNINIREQGKYLGFPIFKFNPLLGKYLPTIPKEAQIIIFGPTGGGKTQFYKRIFMMNYIEFVKKNPNCGLKPRFILNLLEESEQEFIDGLFSMLLSTKYGVNVSKLGLTSMKEKPLSRERLIQIKALEKDVEEILSYCIINDNIYNPYGLYKIAKDYSKTIGTHYYRKLDNKDIKCKEDELSNKEGWCYSHFEYNDNDVQVFVITDHISRLKPEKDTTLHQAMGDWSFEYCRKQMSKNWKFNPINIMQQTVYSEEKSFTNKGDMIWNSLKPGLNDLGDNKSLSQDHHVVLALFNPYRYATSGVVDGYNIAKFNGSYRSIIIRKSRIGEDQREIPFYFNGSSSIFKELPLPNEMTEDIYNKIKNKTY